MVCPVCNQDMAVVAKNKKEIFQCFNCSHEVKKNEE